jgi:starch synthase
MAEDDSPLRILMVTSEAVPFAKTGGLADMVSALSEALAGLSLDVRVVMPRYYGIGKQELQALPGPLGVPMGGNDEWVEVLTARLPGTTVPVYFLDHEGLFGRDGLYGSPTEPEYADNARRFALLSRGAFQVCRKLEWYPHVMHVHDWPAALVPVYLNSLERRPPFHRTAGVLTIHNIGYQGIFVKDDIAHTGLPWEHFHRSGLEFYDGLNFLKSGIQNADLVTTVSPTYAREIQTPEYGHGMDGLLRHRAGDLYGVLNGIDYGTWNPETDPHLPKPFSASDTSGKGEAKLTLLRDMNLQEDTRMPLIGMVGRLVDQKGLPELCAPGYGTLPGICRDMHVQVVILGTGQPWFERMLSRLGEAMPNLAVRIAFHEGLAHRIEGGSDFFLMPSRYEPCGLNQLYSLRYGTLPIVRRTGGLADTVEQYDEATGEGTGFLFDALTPRAVYDTVGWAVSTWYDRPHHIRAMRERAMGRHFGWEESAVRYLRLYREAIARRTGATDGSY